MIPAHVLWPGIPIALPPTFLLEAPREGVSLIDILDIFVTKWFARKQLGCPVVMRDELDAEVTRIYLDAEVRVLG